MSGIDGTDRGGLVVYRAAPGVDAIDEYCRRLVAAICAEGSQAYYVAGGLTAARRTAGAPPWILLQYNPFAYGRAGFAPGVVPDALALRRHTGAPLAVMVHEAWVDMDDVRSTLIGTWQRLQLRSLLRFADIVMTSSEALAAELGRGAVHVPVASTITPTAVAQADARRRLGLDEGLHVALFGRANASRALDYAEGSIAAIAASRRAPALTVLNLGADAPAVHAPDGITVITPGRRSPDELSLWLSAGDMLLLPFTDGVTTRRTTVMAALAHGRAVVGLHGPRTDRVLIEHPQALTLTPVGDRAALADAAVRIARDPDRLRRSGEAARRLYAERFDWPVIARHVLSALEPLTAGHRALPEAA